MSRMLTRFVFFDVPQGLRVLHEAMVRGRSSRMAQAGRGTGDHRAMQVGDVLAEGVFLSADGSSSRSGAFARATPRAPGARRVSSKTFVARKLAYATRLETRDDRRIETLSSTRRSSYGDFVRGYRPTGEAGKFELKDGPFLRVCDRARQDERPHVLIIDGSIADT